MFHFLETDGKVWIENTDIVDNTLNELSYEIKFENCVKDKKIIFLLSETLLFFLEQKYILFLETYFFKISKIFFCWGRY